MADVHLKSVPSHTIVMPGAVACKRRKRLVVFPEQVKAAMGTAYADLATLQVVEAVWKASLDTGLVDASYRIEIAPGRPDGDPPCGCLVWETYAYEEVAS